MEKITIWNSPFLILKYFILYLSDSIISIIFKLFQNLIQVSIFVSLIIAIYILYYTDGGHQETFQVVEGFVVWYGWWVGLGIASSVGLGTGLHTFVLFLAPLIVQTTVTAYACQSLDFKTHGHDSFICPEKQTGNITIFNIFAKVFLETTFWGIGTAIGELPPYFVARAAALAGQDDPEFASIETILKKKRKERTIYENLQVMMHSMMTNLGFWGILICASVSIINSGSKSIV
ncbi:Vacuolar membrane protease [Boothiomyces sp. JEL0838]|nr:Vacuolar membrane protease [Boothiomyces sp. JEL0838]